MKAGQAVSKPAPLAEIKGQSLRTQVLNALRDAILDGELRPGQPLIETELAAQLGVSRAPLREALQTLRGEGLVETVAYKGTTVRALTRADIEELYSLRLNLEIFAVQRIVERGGPSALEGIRAAYDDLARAAEQGNYKAITDADLRFHEGLILLSGHRLLHQVWRGVAMRVRQVMAFRNKQHGNPPQIARNHLAILEAVIDRDLVRATTLLKEHIANAEDMALFSWEAATQTVDSGQPADAPNGPQQTKDGGGQ